VDNEYGENLTSDFAVNDISKVWYRVSATFSTLFAQDSDGDVISHMIYDPWGSPLIETYTDANYSGLDNLNNFTGYTWDEVLGVYYAQNRFYDADEHRFTQQDPVKDGGNWYVYVENNPLIATDPWGMLAVMKYGEGSPVDIREMQKILFSMGYFGWTWKMTRNERDAIIDGFWGNQTLVALIRFQITFAHFSWDNLFDSATGEYYGVGESTLAKLQQAQRGLSALGYTDLTLGNYYQNLKCVGESDPQTLSGQLINEPHVANPMAYVTISGNTVKNNGTTQLNSKYTSSQQLIDFLLSYEGFREYPYYASNNEKLQGIKTIGYGHRIKSNENYDNGISKAEARQLFTQDIKAREQNVVEAIKVPITQHQFDALVSFDFNTGSVKIADLTNHINSKNSTDQQLLNDFLQWTRAGGDHYADLYRRRYDEWEMYTKGEYERNYERRAPEGYN
jgi:lysozyme